MQALSFVRLNWSRITD